MAQGKDGRRYFANAAGVLMYDGVNWTILHIRDKSPVLAVTIPDEKNVNEKLKDKVFVGAKNEFGYLSSENKGKLKYHSLRLLVDSIDEVGDI